MTFDGFISYSHAADGKLAPAVQRGLHRLAKPWHRRRALWIFRDQTGLSVTPSLWTSIQKALDGSDYFVLLASPEAAQSPWVNREIEHWVATKPADRILPVVTDGEWAWDRYRRDFTADSTAVPAALRGVFAEEPLFLDLRWARGRDHLSLQHTRFRDAIAQLAAPMHGVSKDELEGEDVRQHRRVRRLRSGAVATLVVLALVASLTGVMAVRNADRANKAAAEAMRQTRLASQQKGTAEWFAAEARKQQEVARQEQAKAEAAAAMAQDQQELALDQQKLADEAATDADRQQRLADQAATRTKEQQLLAKEAAARARTMATRAGVLAAKAKDLAAEAKRLAEMAAEQQRKAEEYAAEARRQQVSAEEQLRTRVARRLIDNAEASLVRDPATALMLGSAAQAVRSDAEIRASVAGLVTGTHYAGGLDQVQETTFGPDGVLAAIHTGGDVSLWNVADRARPARIRTLPDSTGTARSPVFSRNGRTLAVIDRDTSVTLWNVADRKRPARLGSLSGHAGFRIRSTAFSPDGKTFAVVDYAGGLTLWDLSDRAHPKEVSFVACAEEEGPTFMEQAAFSSDGSMLVLACDTSVFVYDVTDPAEPVVLTDGLGRFSPLRMAAGPVGNLLALGGSGGSVSVFDLTDARKKAGAAEARAAGDTRVPPPLGGDDEDDEVPPPPAKPGGVQLRPVHQLTGLSGAVTTLAFNATGRYLAAGDNSGAVKVWDRTLAATPVVGTMTVNGIAGSGSFHPDSTTLVMTDQSDTATMWKVRPTAVPKRLAAVGVAGGPPELLGFHPDGKTLSGTLNDDTATFYTVTDPAHPAKAKDVAPLNGEGNLAVLSPDRRVFGVAADGKLVLTDVTDPARPARFATIDVGPEARKAAISADGRTLAVMVRGTGLVLWDLAVRARPVRLGTLPTTTADRPRQLVFSPDGRTLATATSGAETVTLFDVHDRTAPVKAGTLAAHTDDASVVAFSPDGRTLASGSNRWR
ncbi:TIR domain-containing protein [Actinoplanes sp. NPDC051633]|uniref:TIR domain-containing protein n=1 Tax=Actinoplanes sp. NPDC051633 TaxID=3155670 RepID=UPI0034272AAD